MNDEEPKVEPLTYDSAESNEERDMRVLKMPGVCAVCGVEIDVSNILEPHFFFVHGKGEDEKVVKVHLECTDILIETFFAANGTESRDLILHKTKATQASL